MINSDDRVAGPFTSGNTYPFEFKIFDEEELVFIEKSAAGVESTKELTTDYTVTLNPDQDIAPGGSVTRVAGAISGGVTVTLTSNVQPLQALQIANLGGFFPAVLNNALDKLTILVQQLLNSVTRSIKFPISDGTNINTTLPTREQRAGKGLKFDSNGDPIPTIYDPDTQQSSIDEAIAAAAAAEGFKDEAQGFAIQAGGYADDAAASAESVEDAYARLLTAFAGFNNNFKNSEFKTGLAVERAGGGGYIDATGLYKVDQVPYTETITNFIRNSGFAGGVAGTVGGTGTVPTNMQIVMGAGSTGTMAFGSMMIGSDTYNYMDLAMTGALTGGGTQLASIYFENLTHITRTQGQPFAMQVLVSRPTGGSTNITSARLRNSEINGSSVAVNESTPVQASVHSSLTTTPVSVKTATPFIMQDAACAAARPWFSVTATTGQVVNYTLRFLIPQGEKRAEGPSPYLVPTPGNADASQDFTYNIAAPNTPRFTWSLRRHLPLGLLVEPGTINKVRNPKGLNAVAGTPGTLPTGWSSDVAGGMTRTVVGYATIQGQNCVLIRLQGTPGPGGSFFNLYTSGNTECDFTNGQVGVQSKFLALYAGTTQGIDRMYLGLLQRDVSGNALTPALGTTNNQKFLKGVYDGSLVRMDSGPLTASNASVAFLKDVTAFISTNPALAIDVTIAVGLSQVRQGYSPGTVVPPLATDLLAATRPTERTVVSNLSTIMANQAYGVAVIDHMPDSIDPTADATIFQFHDTTANNLVGTKIKASDNTGDGTAVTGGSSLGTFTPRGKMIANVPNRTLIAWADNNISLIHNGVLSKLTAGNVGAFTRAVFGDNGYNNNNHYSGTFLNVSIYQQRPTDDVCKILAQAQSGEVDVYAIIGQSNGDGRGQNWSMVDAVAAFLSEACPNLQIYQKPATYVSATFMVDAASFNNDGAWWNMGPFYSAPETRTSQVIGGVNGAGPATQSLGLHGVEMRLAYQHQQTYPNRPLYIIKACVNGSSIEDQWKITNGDAGGLWDWAKNSVMLPALNALRAQGLTPRLKVFIAQGEADTIDNAHATAWQARGQILLNRLRSELVLTDGLHVVPQKIALMQLSTTYNTGFGPTVKAGQAALAAANSADTTLVITDGTGPDAAYPVYPTDLPHFTSVGLDMMAQRVFTVFNS